MSNGTEKPESAPLLDEDGKASPVPSSPVDITTEEESRAAWRHRILALVCTCLLSVGSHYAAHMLGVLKQDIKEDLCISNAQYGLLQSAVSLVNTIMPFFGGIFIDTFGTNKGSLLAASLILIGEVITAISTHLASFPIMVIGRVLYGVGAGSIVTVQESILAYWYEGKGLSVAVGIQIGLSRAASFLANGTVQEIADHTGWYGYAFWVSSAMCFFSWLVTVYYVWMVNNGPKDGKTQAITARLKKKHDFKPRDVLHLAGALWVIVMLSFAFGGVWGPFLHIVADILHVHFGFDQNKAAWLSSLSQIVPIFLTPVLGLLLDKYGHRSAIVMISGATAVVGFSLVGFTYITPILGMLIFSVSLAAGPIAMISSIMVVEELRLVGTALGIYKCASNIGSTIMDPIAGAVQDAATGEDEYTPVLILLTCAAGFAFLLAIVLRIVSRIGYSDLFEKNLAEATALRAQQREIAREQTASLNPYGEEGAASTQAAPEKPRLYSYIFISLSLFMLVVSWAVFFYFVIAEQIREEHSENPVC